MNPLELQSEVLESPIDIPADERDIYGTPVLPDLLVRSEMARLRMKSWKRLSLHRNGGEALQAGLAGH